MGIPMGKHSLVTGHFVALSLVLMTLFTQQLHASNFCGRLLLGGAKLKMDMGFSEAGDMDLSVLSNDTNLLGRAINHVADAILGRALKRDVHEMVVKRLIADQTNDPYFVKFANAFQLQISADEKLENIVKERLGLIKIDGQGHIKELPGPYPGVVFAAKHTSNGSETVALAALISKYRPDVKVVLTSALKSVPGLAENSILVDLSGSAESRSKNDLRRQQMSDQVSSGGVLVIHPSAMVAALPPRAVGGVTQEGPWRGGIYELMYKNPKARFVFVNFNKQPSQTFTKWGNMRVIGEIIRPVLHVREVAKNVGTDFETAFSGAFTGEELARKFNGDKKQVLNFVRSLTNLLMAKFEIQPARNLQPIAEETPRELVAADIQKMQEVAEFRDLKVYLAQGQNIPNVLRELGRLREIAFRAVGEGSGNSIDNDKYDLYYQHLVVVNPQTHQIIGAYRLGETAQIAAERGPSGMYNAEFFNYPHLLQPTGKMTDEKKLMMSTLEAGRTFANPEAGRQAIFFQKAAWRGITKFLSMNPNYRRLLGPVSISNTYSSASKALIVRYLMKNRPHHLAEEIIPNNPIHFRADLEHDIANVLSGIGDLTDLNRIVMAIDGRPIPPLIKSYDDMAGKYAGFNFDKDFNSWDGMVLVDLHEAPTSELIEFFDRDEMQKYYEFQNWPDKVLELRKIPIPIK